MEQTYTHSDYHSNIIIIIVYFAVQHIVDLTLNTMDYSKEQTVFYLN